MGDGSPPKFLGVRWMVWNQCCGRSVPIRHRESPTNRVPVDGETKQFLVTFRISCVSCCDNALIVSKIPTGNAVTIVSLRCPRPRVGRRQHSEISRKRLTSPDKNLSRRKRLLTTAREGSFEGTSLGESASSNAYKTRSRCPLQEQEVPASARRHRIHLFQSHNSRCFKSRRLISPTHCHF